MAIAMQGSRVRPQNEDLITWQFQMCYIILNLLTEMRNFFEKALFKSIRWRRDEGDGKAARNRIQTSI